MIDTPPVAATASGDNAVDAVPVLVTVPDDATASDATATASAPVVVPPPPLGALGNRLMVYPSTPLGSNQPHRQIGWKLITAV